MFGASYVGGYIIDELSKSDWLKNSTEKWQRYIFNIRKTADKYPQESYVSVDRAIQLVWIFLQLVTEDTVQTFMRLENSAGNIFASSFPWKIENPPSNCRISN